MHGPIGDSWPMAFFDCLEAGLVEDKRLTVDGTLVTANASP